MSIRGKAQIVGAFEHPTRFAPDTSLAQLHAEVALGALADAGLHKNDIDGVFCDSDAPGSGALSLCEYLGLKPRHMDSTETGGSSYIAHVSHAAQAIAAGKCSVALITLAGRPKAAGMATGTVARPYDHDDPSQQFEAPYRGVIANLYAMCARRHMHAFGTTSEQLAWIKVAASHHAQHNPHAVLRKVVTVDEVLASPLVADPLHRLDCCVISDGGGALIVARPEVARSLRVPAVVVLGAGEAPGHTNGGLPDLTTSAGAITGPLAFREAGLTPRDIQYASIYDSFTISVLIALEDLGFCAKGEGGRFVEDGGLIAGRGRLPFNTDGGGLCNNHPANRGGMTKVIEAVRQLRGTAHPAVQVPGCRFALAHGTGGRLATRHGSATLILARE
ncbi:thiolase domain-containing protein [Pseudorhodoferax sp.]|uniref:thiolase domain-containing protein n=1 Tax=Pseudorhodoferax sp. TaxID=1993553 RepID=UPI002DD68F58|nr:thiolase domain-containing protein [Pseudorhodoferax sp.]